LSRRATIILRGLYCSLIAVLLVVIWQGHRDQPPRAQPRRSGRGWLKRIDGYLVLHVEGSPEEMGEQHGRLLRPQIQRACKALIRERYVGAGYERLLAGTKMMEKHQPEPFRRELRALARAAEIDYWDCVAMQLYGDVSRGMWSHPELSGTDDNGRDGNAAPAQQCTSFACFGPATKGGELIAGRNLDWLDHGIGEYGAILMHARPDEGNAFVTVTWCGIINGWTLMNDKGIVTANNTSYGGRDRSLKAISTCFMLRKVAQYASTVKQGIEIVETGPRACGTNMLIAGGDPPDAVMVEFDAKAIVVRPATNGYVIADNSFRELHSRPSESSESYGRYGILEGLIKANHGAIDRTMNFAAAKNVPLGRMNLHSALLFPKNLIIRVSMGEVPAHKHRYRGFRMTDDGIVPEDP